MQRYFIPSEDMTNEHVTIRGNDVNHISKVMRKKEGDSLLCLDNRGRVAEGKIVSISSSKIEVSIVRDIEENHELPVKAAIAQALPKSDKLDFIVQKGTELGATEFYPFSAARSVVKWDAKKAQKKQQRLDKIVKEAAEQAERTYLPVIQPLSSFNDILEVGQSFDHRLLVYEESARSNDHHGLVEILSKGNQGETFIIMVGPEGGFTDQEAEKVKEAGWTPVSLGPRILRTESASLYVLSALSYHFELSR